jgi:hypothetical protein
VTQNPTTGAGTSIREFGGRFAEIDYKTNGGNDNYNALQVASLDSHLPQRQRAGTLVF